MSSKSINFEADGMIEFIYDDEIIAIIMDLEPTGLRTMRASHVEPEPEGSGWMVDMAPVGGGTYGPFTTRGFALRFEVEWLKANRGL